MPDPGRQNHLPTPTRCKLLDMPAFATISEGQPAALTVLSDEEKLFQSNVRRFAREQIAPHVREMDEAGDVRVWAQRE